MTWTVPATAVANDIWTSADYNTHVRDNLLETAPAKVSAAGQYLVANGANSLVARTPQAASVVTGDSFFTGAETTGSTTYTDLTTPGPAVTVTTGTKALVHVACFASNNGAFVASAMSFAVSGATTLAADDMYAHYFDGLPVDQGPRQGVWTMLTGLTPGSNTFTAKYKVNFATTTGSFNSRHIIVVPF